MKLKEEILNVQIVEKVTYLLLLYLIIGKINIIIFKKVKEKEEEDQGKILLLVILLIKVKKNMKLFLIMI
jgi:hypothetical protein